jgi:hypothetical protein
MRDFITNSWVVSILTGLMVYGLTKLFETFKERRHYFNILKLANDEVFNTIKVMIPEETLPSPKVLFSLHRATAKKYGVKQEDMNVFPVIIDRLIKEILDSSFLSYQDKIIYSERLLSLTENTQSTNERYDEIKNNILLKEQRSKLYTIVSLILALSSSLFVFLLDLVNSKKLEINKETISNAIVTSFNSIGLMIYFLIALIVLAYVLTAFKETIIDKIRKMLKRK